jgi:hypothetical protein
MNTLATSRPLDAARADRTAVAAGALDRTLVPMGRVLFSLIFLWSGFSHFSAGTIAYAAQAGVPLAGFLVPASGVLAALGGLSVALGWHARLGAAALVVGVDDGGRFDAGAESKGSGEQDGEGGEKRRQEQDESVLRTHTA